MSYGITRTTWCRVLIVTPSIQGLDGTVYDFDDQSGPQSGLVRVDVNLSLSPPNNFALHFAPEQDAGEGWDAWAQRIPQYSLVVIEMSSDGHADGTDPTVMVGLTGAPVANEAYQEGGVTRGVVVPGRGIEAVLWDAKVWWSPFLEDHPDNDARSLRWISGPFREQLTGRMIWAQKVWGRNIDPRAAIVQILMYYLGNHDTGFINLQLPANYLVREILVPGDYSPEDLTEQPIGDTEIPRIPDDWSFIGDQIELPAKMLLPTASQHPMPGAIINLIHRVMDPNFHEFYVLYEQGPRARLVHRTKPWGRGSGERDAAVLQVGESGFADDAPHLETVRITSLDVVSSTLRYGVDPVYNVFMVTPGQGAILSNASFKAFVLPTMATRESDRAFIGRWGVRPLEYCSPYLVVANNGDVDSKHLARTSEALNRVLYRWYDPHSAMSEGTITLVGRAEFRPGRRLVWRGLEHADGGTPDGRPTREWYIQAVKHTYDFRAGAFRSTVQVTRGWVVRESPLGDWIGSDDAARPA